MAKGTELLDQLGLSKETAPYIYEVVGDLSFSDPKNMQAFINAEMVGRFKRLAAVSKAARRK